jgi:hypothetical protein
VTGPIPCDQTGVTVTCTPTMIQDFVISNLSIANAQMAAAPADTTKCNPTGSSSSPNRLHRLADAVDARDYLGYVVTVRHAAPWDARKPSTCQGGSANKFPRMP